MHPGHFHGRECRQFLFQKFGNERAILTIRNIAKKKKNVLMTKSPSHKQM